MRRNLFLVAAVLGSAIVGLWWRGHRDPCPATAPANPTRSDPHQPAESRRPGAPLHLATDGDPARTNATPSDTASARPQPPRLSPAEISTLMAAYRAERDPRRKHALGRRLAEGGDARVLKLFTDELFADYGGRVFPQEEGLRRCSIPNLLGLLGRRAPEARKILLQGVDPVFWRAHMTWTLEGDSAVDLLVRSCITGVASCRDESTWAALLAFRDQQSVSYLFHFSGSFVDAACDRYWIGKKGFDYAQSRSLRQRLADLRVWYKTPEGRTWKEWKDRVRDQWLATAPEKPASRK